MCVCALQLAPRIGDGRVSHACHPDLNPRLKVSTYTHTHEGEATYANTHRHRHRHTRMHAWLCMVVHLCIQVLNGTRTPIHAGRAVRPRTHTHTHTHAHTSTPVLQRKDVPRAVCVMSMLPSASKHTHTHAKVCSLIMHHEVTIRSA